MKKLIILGLVALFALSLSACGGGGSNEEAKAALLEICSTVGGESEACCSCQVDHMVGQLTDDELKSVVEMAALIKEMETIMSSGDMAKMEEFGKKMEAMEQNFDNDKMDKISTEAEEKCADKCGS